MTVIDNSEPPLRPARLPSPGATLTLMKPVTWFPPMWAYLCGVASSGAPLSGQLGTLAVGLLLAGPLVCGMSQAANDWCDRHVDAINEPGRPIPSGRVPGRWGLWIAFILTLVSLGVGWSLGPWAFGATLVGVAAAWAYSAEPIRLKRNGWWSAGVCGLSYETLPWITGAAVATAAAPDWRVVVVAGLYGLGAHGIMTLNDFKSIEGDLKFGLASLPARLGPAQAARVALTAIFAPQWIVVALLMSWGQTTAGVVVAAMVLGQSLMTPKLLDDPKGRAVWFAGFGVLLYVIGMMASALALRDVLGG